MTGYYLATYSFEKDLQNSNPNGWIISEPSGTDIHIEDEVNKHKNVLSINDWNQNIESYASKNLDQQIGFGTIEYWFCSEGTGNPRVVDFRTGNGNVHGAAGNPNLAFTVYSTNGQISAYNGSYNLMGTYSANEWVHIRIDFECTTGHYQGLEQYQAKFYYNGNEIVILDYYNQKEYLDIIDFETWGWGCQIDEEAYIDAVGLAWDPDYNIGDNHNEGILLSFTNSTNLDWVGYSLDGQLNKTILGNITIPIPINGLHSIRIYANDSFDTIYESNLVYFTVNISPTTTTTDGNGGDGNSTTGKPSDNANIIIIFTILGLTALAVLGISFIYIKRRNIGIKPDRKKQVIKTEVEPIITNCPYCHNKIPPGVDVCSYCGTDLKKKLG